MSFYTDFVHYLEKISDSLVADKEASAIFTNTTDAGGTREDLLYKFFNSHLPNKAEILKGGFIFDLDGNQSKQIDLFVTHESTVQFKKFIDSNAVGKSFNFIGGCIAAISVKSNLDGAEVEDALKNLASIPKFPFVQKDMNPNIKVDKFDFNELPLKILFAFSGLTVGTILNHIDNFYSKNQCPEWQKANIIFVNKEYLILKSRKNGGVTLKGDKIPPDIYYSVMVPHVSSYALFYILTKIQENSALTSNMLFDFTEILNKIAET